MFLCAAKGKEHHQAFLGEYLCCHVKREQIERNEETWEFMGMTWWMVGKSHVIVHSTKKGTPSVGTSIPVMQKAQKRRGLKKCENLWEYHAVAHSTKKGTLSGAVLLLSCKKFEIGED